MPQTQKKQQMGNMGYFVQNQLGLKLDTQILAKYSNCFQEESGDDSINFEFLITSNNLCLENSF